MDRGPDEWTGRPHPGERSYESAKIQRQNTRSKKIESCGNTHDQRAAGGRLAHQASG